MESGEIGVTLRGVHNEVPLTRSGSITVQSKVSSGVVYWYRAFFDLSEKK